MFCQGQEGGIGNDLDERVTQRTERQARGADIFGGASVRLRVGADGALRLLPEIGRVDAPGLIGDLLRSGSPGETMRDTITESLLSTVRWGGDFSATLPPAARGGATLHRAEFQGTGSGKLLVVLDGEIRMSNEQVISLTNELKEPRPAPATVQATVPH